jgi:hypothetical protein
MLTHRQVKAACPVAWKVEASDEARKWLTGEPLYEEFYNASLRVVSPLTGPGRATHLIRRDYGDNTIFYLAELHSYRYEVERYQFLLTGASDDALVMVYEVEGPGCSPWLQELPEVLGKAVGRDFADLTFEPLPRKKHGAVASFQSAEGEPYYEEGAASRWLVHVYELPFQPSGRTGSFRVKKKRTPPGSIPKPEPVWRVWWDSGGPGAGAGVDTIHKLGNRYFYYCFDAAQMDGPYTSLADAVAGTGLDWVNEATGRIESPVLSAEQIAMMLNPTDIENGFTLSINGEEWVYCGAKGFQPASSEDCEKGLNEPQQEESLEDLMRESVADDPHFQAHTPSEQTELIRTVLDLWQGAPAAPESAPPSSEEEGFKPAAPEDGETVPGTRAGQQEPARSRGRKTAGDEGGARGKKPVRRDRR